MTSNVNTFSVKCKNFLSFVAPSLSFALAHSDMMGA
uniref:Uncharacterized protein n=1 Tax=Siphoviridae sp. ctNHj22 TaxID=2825468 RepID=A0A8S5VFQ3_9CAUD|nr:MAG TPA: hypothetical protein [Siphoviridae sp. ctNHj22]